VKNKLAAPFQTTEFDIRYGVGIDAIGDLLDTAVEREIVKKSGAYYAYEGNSLGQGRERAREALSADAALRDRIRQRLMVEPVAVTRGNAEAPPEMAEVAA
jgi:recombination protein RecA